MKEENIRNKSILIETFSDLIEWVNKHFTVANWFLKKDAKEVFYKIEMMMIGIMVILLIIFFTLHLMPTWLMVTLSFLLVQRLIEFVVVYARNFIFGRGRIFTHFRDPLQRGEWLLMMFSLNAIQIALIFSIWYRVIGMLNPSAFSQPLDMLNSLYYSVITFLTVGYGDIVPLSTLAKSVVLIQNALTFYIFVIVINGLISIHFIKK